MTEAKVLTKVLPLENNKTSQKNEENIIDNNGEDKISKQSEKAPINDDPINNETVQAVDVNNNNNNIKSEISDIKTIINHNNTCDGPTTSVEQIEAIKENINNEHIETIEENVNNEQIEAIKENVNNEQIEATEENVNNNEQIKALKEITKNDKECTISAATNLKTFDNQQQKVMVSSGVVETKKTVAFVDEVVTEENGKRIGDTEECEEEDEDRFRVDRKKLESLLRDEQNNTRQDSGFFQRIEEATNTTISWPAKLKIGAKSKKDPYIKVAGLPEDRLAAKQMVLSVMDTKSTRVTLKMDVSFTDHSHIIGKGGNTIKKVMKDTQCHIHFPDSNRTSSEKSNQVSIAGPPFCVESARRQIRELLPIVLKFEIPSTALIPDSSSPVIVNIAQTHGVTVSFQQQLCGYGYIGSVRGLHSDPFSVRDAILKVLEHLTGRVPVTVPVTTQFEIDPKHHIYVIGRNGSNIKKITSVCGASIHFADPHDPTTRRSTVTVTGSIESAVNAKVYLLEYLPLILMFDIRDGENEARLEEGALRNLMDSLEVQIIMKPKPRQYCKSLIIKSHEKNASNVYRTRLHLIGEDPANMPFLLSPLATLVMPHHPIHPFHLLPPPLNGFAPPRHPLMNSQSNSPLSPPVQSSSPLIGQNNQRNDLIGQNNQRNTIGSEMKMKRLSFDALITKSSEGESEEIDGPRGNLSGAGLNDSWRNHPQSVMDPVHKGSNGSVDSGLSQSQEELNDNISMTNQMLKNLALHNESKVADDYELRKQMAKNAMHSQVTYGKARTPTDLWSGFGFSNSMPESVIKELWNNREKRMNAKPKLNEIQQSPDGSLNSSHSSHESGGSRVTSNNGVGSPVRRPPPGLEDSFPSRDNLLLLNNNRDFGFSMSGRTSPMNSVYANVKTLAELFEKIGLEQYSEAFVKEEVDLNTFMSLTDQDLKELGVNTFGARKKMQNAMRELQIYQNKQNSPIMPQQPSLSPAFYHHIDVAAHSLRW